jgi:hypothetical protein
MNAQVHAAMAAVNKNKKLYINHIMQQMLPRLQLTKQ